DWSSDVCSSDLLPSVSCHCYRSDRKQSPVQLIQRSALPRAGPRGRELTDGSSALARGHSCNQSDERLPAPLRWWASKCACLHKWSQSCRFRPSYLVVCRRDLVGCRERDYLC